MQQQRAGCGHAIARHALVEWGQASACRAYRYLVGWRSKRAPVTESGPGVASFGNEKAQPKRHVALQARLELELVLGQEPEARLGPVRGTKGEFEPVGWRLGGTAVLVKADWMPGPRREAVVASRAQRYVHWWRGFEHEGVH